MITVNHYNKIQKIVQEHNNCSDYNIFLNKGDGEIVIEQDPVEAFMLVRDKANWLWVLGRLTCMEGPILLTDIVDIKSQFKAYMTLFNGYNWVDKTKSLSVEPSSELNKKDATLLAVYAYTKCIENHMAIPEWVIGTRFILDDILIIGRETDKVPSGIEQYMNVRYDDSTFCIV